MLSPKSRNVRFLTIPESEISLIAIIESERENYYSVSMKKFVQRDKRVVKAWLVELCSDLALSEVGAALLDAQITNLEKRCAAIHDQIERRSHRTGLKKRKGHGTNGHTKQRALFCAT